MHLQSFRGASEAEFKRNLRETDMFHDKTILTILLEK